MVTNYNYTKLFTNMDGGRDTKNRQANGNSTITTMYILHQSYSVITLINSDIGHL